MKTRDSGIINCTPAADYTEKEGYGVTLAVTGGVLTATISGSASVPIAGIIVEGGTVAQGISIVIPGNAQGGFTVKLSGTVAQGAQIIQAADGTFVTDSGSGARVAVGRLGEGGVSGDLVEAFPQTPTVLS